MKLFARIALSCLMLWAWPPAATPPRLRDRLRRLVRQRRRPTARAEQRRHRHRPRRSCRCANGATSRSPTAVLRRLVHQLQRAPVHPRHRSADHDRGVLAGRGSRLARRPRRGGGEAGTALACRQQRPARCQLWPGAGHHRAAPAHAGSTGAAHSGDAGAGAGGDQPLRPSVPQGFQPADDRGHAQPHRLFGLRLPADAGGEQHLARCRAPLGAGTAADPVPPRLDKEIP